MTVAWRELHRPVSIDPNAEMQDRDIPASESGFTRRRLRKLQECEKIPPTLYSTDLRFSRSRQPTRDATKNTPFPDKALNQFIILLLIIVHETLPLDACRSRDARTAPPRKRTWSPLALGWRPAWASVEFGIQPYFIYLNAIEIDETVFAAMSGRGIPLGRKRAGTGTRHVD